MIDLPKILEITTFKKGVIIATVVFPKSIKPYTGMEFKDDKNKRYKITGVVLSSNSQLLSSNMNKNIYECKIEEL